MADWNQIQKALMDKGASAEEIQQAYKELGGNQSSSSSPMQASQSISSLKSFGGRSGAQFESVNPALEEYKKSVEKVTQIKDLLSSLDVIKETADRLIPAADTVKLGPFETGFMGDVKGLQRQIGNAPFIRTEEGGLRQWEQFQSSLGSLLARGFGEKGALTEADIDRVTKWLPKENDTKKSRDQNILNIKKYLQDQVNVSTKRIVSLNPSLLEQYNSSQDKNKFLESLTIDGTES